MNGNSTQSDDQRSAPTDAALARASSVDGRAQIPAAVVLTPYLAMDAQAQAAQACVGQLTDVLETMLRISTVLMTAGQDPGRSAMAPLTVAAVVAGSARVAVQRWTGMAQTLTVRQLGALAEHEPSPSTAEKKTP